MRIILLAMDKEVRLNDNQKAAVDHTDGPLLVVAGAGTGKTRVIVERIVRLIDNGVDRDQILALTFTEKAAAEMLDRVAERLSESYGVEIAIHTFNAFGQLLLQEFAVEIGLSSSLKLIGDDGKVVFLRERLDELDLDYFAPVSKPDTHLATIAGYFSELKQQLVTPERYLKFAEKLPAADEADRLERKKHLELAKAYGHYIDAMKANNTIDYDDQIFLLINLLEARPNVAKILRQRYKYIMIDEFQDTNPMQSRLIDLLAGDDKNVFVVGDDDQAIYGWRGATLANILEFTKRYPKAKEITLIDNYRSTQPILDAAWRLIQNNNPDRLEHLNRLNKRLRADRKGGVPPAVRKFSRLEAELSWVGEDVIKRLKDGYEPGQIAILARSRRIVARMHDVLSSSGIEHVTAGLGEDLYEQPAIRMMVEALQAIWQPSNDTALYHTLSGRLFRCPIQEMSSSAHKARSEKTPLIDILEQSSEPAVTAAVKQIRLWHEQIHDLTVRSASYRILTDSGLKDRLYLAAKDDPAAAREVYALGQWFATLVDFERITITPSVNSYLENFAVLRAEGEELVDDTVNLSPDLPAVMTVHKAKGLEWKLVYVVDCSASSFPYLAGGKSLKLPDELKMQSAADDRLNEERRLMYVAATRARDELILTYAERSRSDTIRNPSRFIEEMGLEEQSASEQEAPVSILEEPGLPTDSEAIGLPSSMIEGELINLSVSQADDYLRCPLNFYYRHVLGVPEVPGPQTAVGNLFHAAIQDINTAKLSGKRLPDKTQLTARIENDWPTVGYSSKIQRERALSHGVTAFDALYDRLAAESVPVAVEERFRVRIPDSKLILRGRVDVVMPTENGIEIRDYKTSTSVSDRASAKEKAAKNQQLTMYALAWRLMHDEMPALISLDFVQTGYLGQARKQARSLDSMEEKLKQAAEAILRGEFAEGNGTHEYCVHP